jgi:hypothetical protein
MNITASRYYHYCCFCYYYYLCINYLLTPVTYIIIQEWIHEFEHPAVRKGNRLSPAPLHCVKILWLLATSRPNGRYSFPYSRPPWFKSGPRPGILTEGFCGFPQSLQVSAEIDLKSSNYRFLPHPFQFIIDLSSYLLFDAISVFSIN